MIKNPVVTSSWLGGTPRMTIQSIYRSQYTMDNKELETIRNAAIAENKCFSKSLLRDEFRMKPQKWVIKILYLYYVNLM